MAKPKKKKSRLKRLFKGLKKAALLGGAAYGASKLFGGRKGGQEGDIGIGLRAPRVDDYNYTPRVPDHPSNIQSIPGGGSAPMTWRRHINKAIGTNFKKGGRVTGIAKRGFGRALMKGKK